MRASLFAMLGVAVIALTGEAHARGTGCKVRGKRVEETRVRVASEGRSFELFVRDVPATAFLGVSGHLTRVEVMSAIAFAGDSVAPPFALSRSVNVSGVARLDTSVRLKRVRIAPHGVVADVMPSDDDVSLPSATIPCESLTLDAPPVSSNAMRPPAGLIDDGLWLPKAGVLTFRPAPDDPRTVVLHVAKPELVMLSLFEEPESRWQSPWVKAWVDLGGASMTGWVARSAIAEVTNLSGIGGMMGSFSDAACGFGSTSSNTEYRGPASLVMGTVVYAEPEKSSWGTVQSVKDVEVVHEAGASWVQIVEANGLSEDPHCPGLTHAWVRRDAVVFPKGAVAK
jgi:hypothetical protein